MEDFITDYNLFFDMDMFGQYIKINYTLDNGDYGYIHYRPDLGEEASLYEARDILEALLKEDPNYFIMTINEEDHKEGTEDVRMYFEEHPDKDVVGEIKKRLTLKVDNSNTPSDAQLRSLKASMGKAKDS